MPQTQNYVYISLIGKYASTWIWNLGSLICIHPDRWHTALLEIDFMMNKMCLEGSSSLSGLIFGVWYILQGPSGCCPWGLMPWLHLCSEVSSELLVTLCWVALLWSSSVLEKECRRKELLIENNGAWNICRARNFKQHHRALCICSWPYCKPL